MKKYLLVLFIGMYGASVYGQSISLLNLMNLTTLNNKEAGDNLTSSKVFGLQFGEQVDGFVVEHYQTTAPADKKETVIIGTGFKTASGAVLHTVSYISPDTKNVMNIMAQAKSSGLVQLFRGSDREDNIYIFDSFLYHVIVRVAINNSKGVVDVSEKQVFVE